MISCLFHVLQGEKPYACQLFISCAARREAVRVSVLSRQILPRSVLHETSQPAPPRTSALSVQSCETMNDIYRPHLKDGEGNVFSLFIPVGGGGGGVSPAGGGGSGQSSRGGGSGQSSRGGLGQSTRGGVSHPRVGGGQSSWGGSAKIGQQNEYSLHGGRYASCIHAGGLSCLLMKLNFHVDALCVVVDPGGEQGGTASFMLQNRS